MANLEVQDPDGLVRRVVYKGNLEQIAKVRKAAQAKAEVAVLRTMGARDTDPLFSHGVTAGMFMLWSRYHSEQAAAWRSWLEATIGQALDDAHVVSVCPFEGGQGIRVEYAHAGRITIDGDQLTHPVVHPVTTPPPCWPVAVDFS